VARSVPAQLRPEDRDMASRGVPGLQAVPVIQVLLETRARLCLYGWSATGVGGWTLIDALNSTEVTIHRWHARVLLQRLSPDSNLVRWVPRYGRAVVELIDDAIRELGGVPPRHRYRARQGRHGGGWFVTSSQPERIPPLSGREPGALGRRRMVRRSSGGFISGE
jgi:hypothetical protein